jgi:hypothetical protein
VSAAIAEGSPILAAGFLSIAVFDWLCFRRLLLLSGVSQHPDAIDTPLILVRSDSPRRCIFRHSAQLSANEEAPLVMASPPGQGLVVSGMPVHYSHQDGNHRQLLYHRTAVGPASAAASARMESKFLVLNSSLVLSITDNTFYEGYHVTAIGNVDDERQYDDKWPTFSGYPRTFSRPDGRCFQINSDKGTISPVGAPHLVLGHRDTLAFVALTDSALVAPAESNARVRRPSSLEVVTPAIAELVSPARAVLLQVDGAKWMNDALGGILIDIADEKTAPKGSKTEPSPKKLAAREQLQETCEQLVLSMPSYNRAQLAALCEVMRAYMPNNTDDGETSDKLCKQLKEVLVSPVSQLQAVSRAAEPPPPHPMRGAPLSTVLHSNVLMPSDVGEHGTFWGSRADHSEVEVFDFFQLSRNVTRCKNFCSHNWRDDGNQKVRQLGFVLIYGHLCTAAVIISLVLSTFQWVLEFSLASAFGLPLNWIRPLVPFALMALVLTWTMFSMKNILPPSLTPAGVTERLGGGTTVWIVRHQKFKQRLAAPLRSHLAVYHLSRFCRTSFVSIRTTCLALFHRASTFSCSSQTA